MTFLRAVSKMFSGALFTNQILLLTVLSSIKISTAF